ncbi:MAG: tripartite tricarboxylate transporter TctB family protein [Thermodesulfobacteriota bacterium]
MNLANRLWGLVLIGVGAFYLIEGYNLPPAAIGDPLGPMVFPTVLGSSLIACGVYLAVRPGPRPPQPILTRQTFIQIFILFVLLLLYSASISWMGYPVSTFIFVSVAAYLMGERSWVKGILISAAFSAGIFILFVRILTIPLPLGVLKIFGLN